MAHYYHKIVSPWLRTDSKSKTVDLGTFSDKYVEMLKDIQWIGSEKIDGTNLNFYYDGNHVHVYEIIFPCVQALRPLLSTGILKAGSFIRNTSTVSV